MLDIKIPDNFGHTPSPEQVNIVKKVLQHDRLKIEALAGSAKSTTLMLAAHNLEKTSLYLAFNKGMQMEASRMFPSHVEVRTTHSLAYKAVGWQYQHKLTRPLGEYVNVLGTGAEIAREFRMAPFPITADKSISATTMGWAVKQTVNRFEYSPDKELKEHHVSMHEAGVHRLNKKFNESEYRKRVLRYAIRLWKKRIDLQDVTLCNHDTYMKLFQLSNPQLDEWDVIYVDEFQDTNPCLLQIILNQKGKKIIAVGDRYQNIYSWRGTTNALAKVDWEEATLSKSFRFGDSVADVARGVVLNEDMLPFIHIEGFEKRHTEVVNEIPSNITKDIVYVYRTNAALLEKALELIAEGKSVGVYVDLKDFVSKVESVVALHSGEKKKVKHQDIIPYTTWEEIDEEAKLSKGELARIVKMVATGKHLDVLKLLKSYKPPKNPEVELITAHKSKGLTFSNVVIGDDFDPLETNSKTGTLGYINDQERNLLYVALTRAQDLLVLSDTIITILDINNLCYARHEDQMYEYDGMEEL